MNGSRNGLATLLVVGLFCCSGADCSQMFRQYWAPQEPRILPASPSLAQVVETVNRNSSQIQSFSANRATLSGPGWPSLQANLAFERPKRFRMRAGTALLGPEVDLGSNDQIFWFWVRRNQPPGVYFCRHDQFATGRARQMIPIEPDWLIQALGVMEFDSGPHEGPLPLPGDKLEIRTVRQTPEGPITKVTVVDAGRAWVLQQRIHDAQGNLRASAIAEAHRRDPVSKLIMPRTVRIEFPPANFSMRIDLGEIEINRLVGNPAELWALPTYPGSPPFDLCNPAPRTPPAGPGVSGRAGPGMR